MGIYYAGMLAFLGICTLALFQDTNMATIEIPQPTMLSSLSVLCLVLYGITIGIKSMFGSKLKSIVELAGAIVSYMATRWYMCTNVEPLSTINIDYLVYIMRGLVIIQALLKFVYKLLAIIPTNKFTAERTTSFQDEEKGRIRK